MAHYRSARWFQICTLKPSRATVSKGTAIALSGIVPIKGHYGSKKGTPKYVTIYKTTSSRRAAKYQPPIAGEDADRPQLDQGRQGPHRRPRQVPQGLDPSVRATTWYCAWYPGDSWYWGAWTSVAKVTEVGAIS